MLKQESKQVVFDSVKDVLNYFLISWGAVYILCCILILAIKARHGQNILAMSILECTEMFWNMLRDIHKW